MSQWKVPDMNDTNGEGEYNGIISGNRNMLPRREKDKNPIKIYIFH